MTKIWIIIQREYITRVKRRNFIITTLLAPLGFLALMLGSVLISTYSQGRMDVAIIDDSGLFKDISIPDADDQTVYFHRVSESYELLAKTLPNKEKEERKYSAILHIPSNFNINTPNHPPIAYRYVDRPGVSKKQFINQRINEAVSKQRMRMLQLDEALQEQMQKRVQLDYSSIDKEEEVKGYTEAAGIAGMIMGMAIYISLFFYGTMIMKGVMEEKTSRIVEVLTSSVKPFQLLMGKIVGIGAVGLTQFIIWMVLMFGINIVAGVIFAGTINPQIASGSMNAEAVDPDEIQQMIRNISSLPFTQIAILFPLFFLGGFLLYGALFAAVGAAMGEDGDQQSLMIPVTIPIILSVIIAMNVINNPDGALGFWGSIIPFTSPVVMCALLPFRPDWWQIALSLLLLAGGFIFTTFVAARIYRTGILMYGKKVNIRDIAGWIFLKN